MIRKDRKLFNGHVDDKGLKVKAVIKAVKEKIDLSEISKFRLKKAPMTAREHLTHLRRNN